MCSAAWPNLAGIASRSCSIPSRRRCWLRSTPSSRPRSAVAERRCCSSTIPVTPTSAPRLGAADGDAVVALRASVRLVPHLWLSAPLAAVFDAERQGSFNWFAWAGVPTLSGAEEPGHGFTVRGFTAFGADARYRYSAKRSFNATLTELGAFTWNRSAPTAWATQFTLGLSESVPGSVTFSLGAGVVANLLADGTWSSASAGSVERNLVVAFGSVQRIGLRTLPLIHVLVGESFGIDAYAIGAYVPSQHGWVETYMAGVSYEH